ncbi:MAG: hypothetical protein MUP69_10440 [Candidatus Atribacteria bacterium]|nr:hypothetical protein [Candidatus Atribacteria bacterium]
MKTKSKAELKDEIKIIRNNFYTAINMCSQAKGGGIRMSVQKCERSFLDEFVLYKDTWATNPDPLVSVFLSDASDVDFISKLEDAIKKFYKTYNKIKKNKKG